MDCLCIMYVRTHSSHAQYSCRSYNVLSSHKLRSLRHNRLTRTDISVYNIYSCAGNWSWVLVWDIIQLNAYKCSFSFVLDMYIHVQCIWNAFGHISIQRLNSGCLILCVCIIGVGKGVVGAKAKAPQSLRLRYQSRTELLVCDPL